ncbi:MAG: hypothetical protein JHC87_01180 [Thermoleophilaceae bacterium]|nr:hypothetical protein [Thermoleophilaceae bacterium]
MSELSYVERRPAGVGECLLILHHGRGSDELDLMGLADVLDPAGRMHIVSPRAPLQLPGSPGYHWYTVPRVGHPDPETFQAAFVALSALHDQLWLETGFGPQQTVLGGFSMGAVLSYSMGLASARPTVAGILAFSGFIPTVSGWEADLGAHAGTRVFISHGRNDPILPVDLARQADARLFASQFDVTYVETDAVHNIDFEQVTAAAAWLGESLPTSVT